MIALPNIADMTIYPRQGCGGYRDESPGISLRNRDARAALKRLAYQCRCRFVDAALQSHRVVLDSDLCETAGENT
jgi:hypothetical protein